MRSFISSAHPCCLPLKFLPLPKPPPQSLTGCLPPPSLPSPPLASERAGVAPTAPQPHRAGGHTLGVAGGLHPSQQGGQRCLGALPRGHRHAGGQGQVSWVFSGGMCDTMEQRALAWGHSLLNIDMQAGRGMCDVDVGWLVWEKEGKLWVCKLGDPSWWPLICR